MLLLIIGAAAPQIGVFADVSAINHTSTREEIPQELTDEELQKQVEEIRRRSEAGLIVTIDLEDPNGIDPKLLPSDIALLVDTNTKIVAFREARRPTTFSLSSTCNEGMIGAILGIICDNPDLTYDVTAQKTFGGITQFNRLVALRYDNYSGCDVGNCYGWEFELQRSKWTRTNSTWSIGSSSAKMVTTSTIAENYCTGTAVQLDYQSTWFSPTFSGNTTGWYSISGFPDIAYVPWPTAVNYVRSNIYQNGVLQYSDARTNHVLPFSP